MKDFDIAVLPNSTGEPEIVGVFHLATAPSQDTRLKLKGDEHVVWYAKLAPEPESAAATNAQAEYPPNPPRHFSRQP